MRDSSAITWRELRYLVPLIISLAGFIYFLSTISSNVNAIQAALVDEKLQVAQLSSTIDIMKGVQATQGQDIAVIKEILQHNNLTIAKQIPDQTLAMAAPRSSGQSASLQPVPVYSPQNNTVIVIAPTPQPTNMPQTVIQSASPTPVPTPKPTSSPCVVNLLQLCI